LAKALDEKGISYREMPGEAVFYGPKIDVNIVDASDREWQCTTIQFDFNLPKRFNITYTGADGKEHGVVMIHRALLGAVERFMGVLTEHYRGNFPVWLAPVQARILPVGEEQVSYAQEISEKLRAHGIRVEVDCDASTIGHKIREAELQKIPYMIVCGKREAKLNRISVRRHGAGNIGMLTIEDFVRSIRNSHHE